MAGRESGGNSEAAGDPHLAAENGDGAGPSDGARVARVEADLVRERARVAELDLQVRALCAEMELSSGVTGKQMLGLIGLI